MNNLVVFERERNLLQTGNAKHCF